MELPNIGEEKDKELEEKLDHVRGVFNFYKENTERLMERVSYLENMLNVGIENTHVLTDIQE